MKIIEQYTKSAREVYAIYWADYQGKQQRYHYIIPTYDFSGIFYAVSESQCEIVDENINNFVIVKSSDGSDMFVHPVLKKENGLLDSILDGELNAMKFFLEKLTERGEYFPNKVELSSSYPSASEHAYGFYFCPNCFEANKVLNEYDEAIRCKSCETMFNLT